MKVVILASAENDLREIGDWIARDNNERAIIFTRDLIAACMAVSDMPRAYPLLPRHAASGVRRKPFRSYLIFYWLKNGAVEILHVIHAARDYEKILFPE